MGAYDTDFLRQLLTRNHRLYYYLNEIDEVALEQMAIETTLDPLFYTNHHRVSVVRGGVSTTGLLPNTLDKIIIRNAFHHFENAPSMLVTIQTSLKAGGELLIKEAFKDQCVGDCCTELISTNKFKQVLQEAGFELLREQVLIDPNGFNWSFFRYSYQGS